MNGDGKRRLPTWMLGVADADHVRKSEESEKVVVRNTQHAKVNKRVAAKSKKAEIGMPEKDDISEISKPSISVLTRCRRKTQRQENTIEDEDIGDVEVSKKITVTKKWNREGRRKTQAGGTKRLKKTDNLGDESSDEIEAPSPGEDDVDLTVEDLLSIAQEYVSADGRIEQQISSTKEQNNCTNIPPTDVSVDKSRELPVGPENNRGSSLRTESISIANSTGNLVAEGTFDTSRRTGDPAQDMLDLLLGPLFRKPPGDENEIKSMEEETFEYEFRKQSQKSVAEEQLPPLTKKKCSLKDKVATLLDI